MRFCQDAITLLGGPERQICGWVMCWSKTGVIRVDHQLSVSGTAVNINHLSCDRVSLAH